MPVNPPDVGTGSVAVFGTSATAMQWTSIDLGEKTLEVINVDHLGSSGTKSSMCGDLKTVSPIVLEGNFDNEKTPLVSTTSETLTITFPMAAHNTTAATYAGVGFVTGVKLPTLTVEGLQTGTVTFTPVGDFIYTNADTPPE